MAAFNPYPFRNRPGSEIQTHRGLTASCGNAESLSNFLNARAGIITSYIIVPAPVIVL
ncbi:MAG: hypothetical protein WCH30_04010 [Chlorobiaceae bacterium]